MARERGVAAETAIALPTRPYPGLRPFDKSEWRIFFGREPMAQQVIERLVARHLVAVHGDSGSGKSSLIAAGVLPVLESDQSRAGGRWRTFTARPLHPTSSPLANLATAFSTIVTPAKAGAQLATGTEPDVLSQADSWAPASAGVTDGGEARAIRRILNRGALAPRMLAKHLGCSARNNVCILIDQFEELFEHAEREGNVEARLVTDFLVGLFKKPPPGLHAILTMRSDYLGRCARYEGFAEAVNATQYLVPRMERPALMRAIREPARLYGGSVSEELADRLIAEAGQGQDQLPLIQHGLMRLWQEERAKGDRDDELTLADLGTRGLKDLLSDHADELMPKYWQDTETLGTVFRALAERNDKGLEVRRSVPFKALCAIANVDANKLNTLLLPFRAEEASFLRPHGTKPLEDGEKVDVSHESFIRNWDKYQPDETGGKGWLDLETDDRLQWSSLNHTAARRWGFLFPTEAWSAWRWLKKRNEAWISRFKGGNRAAVNRLVNRSFAAGLVLVSTLLIAGTAVAYQYLMAERSAKDAQHQAERSLRNETIALSSLSRAAVPEGFPADAVKLALAAWPRTSAADRPKLRRTIDALAAALPRMHERLRLSGHTGVVTVVAISPDGARILTGSSDGTARLWDAATGSPIKTLEGHTRTVTAAVFSPDGARIVTGSSDKTARIWDAATGSPIKTLEGHSGTVTAAVFSPDGARIVTGSLDKTARIWDAATGSPIKTLEGHTDLVTAAVFSPDGARIVTGSWDKTARIWDAATGSPIKTLGGISEEIYSAAFSPDGARIVTASYDNTARIWDAATGSPIKTLEGHTGAVIAALFSPDGARIVTASDDNTARIWDAATGSPIKTLEGHTGRVIAAVFSPDGARIVTGSLDKTARIWDAATGSPIKTLEGHTRTVTAAVFSPDGARIVTGSLDKTARIWDAATGSPIKTLEGHTGNVTAADFSPDGARIVTGSRDKTARILDAATGSLIMRLEGHTDTVTAAVFSPDGLRIVTGSMDKTARIWDAATGGLIKTLKGNTRPVHAAVFSPNGARIVTGSRDRTARISDAATGSLIMRLEGHTDTVTAAVFSPDGARIVTGSLDKTARIWDAATGSPIKTLEGHSDTVTAAVFSPDGARIVTGSRDRTARIWDAATGSPIKTLEGHSDDVTAAVFSPDGARIVTGSSDKTARIWDAATGSLMKTLEGHTSSVIATAFSPDGARIMTWSGDDTARIWDISGLEKGNAFDVACQRLGNNTSLKDVEERYQLDPLPPICGEFKPLPVDLRELQ